MTFAKRLLVRLLERLLGKYEEGPTAPSRFGEVVLEYVRDCPRATRQEWVDFATRHACTAYREGYVRGYEWCDRDPRRMEPEMEPEALMDVIDPAGEWRRNPVDLQAVDVVDERDVDVGEEIGREMQRVALYAERRARGPVVR
jgi:hypothetical protein